MKTIFESYLELKERVENLESSNSVAYQKDFFNLLSQYIYTNPSNSDEVFRNLSELGTYEEKYFYLKEKMYPKNYINKKTLDYLEKIRNL